MKKHRTYGWPLSKREAEIMPLIVRGLSLKMMAREIGVEVRTIKSHVSHILHKLGCATRLEIIARSALPPVRSAKQKKIEAQQASLRG